jgi:two-component system NarL family response regulator
MITVSLVEDHKKTAVELSNIINQSKDFMLLNWFSNGKDALLGILKELPDIVIMDIGLPGMNGIECITHLKEKIPDLKIVVLTVFEDEDNILKAIEAGANGYLLKDIEASLLIAELHVMHLGGAPMSPAIAVKIIDQYKLDKVISSKKESDSHFEKNNSKSFNSELQIMLSKREIEVLSLISLGYIYTDISDELDISSHTVRRHIENIYKKMNVNSKSQAIIKGRRLGLLGTFED